MYIVDLLLLKFKIRYCIVPIVQTNEVLGIPVRFSIQFNMSASGNRRIKFSPLDVEDRCTDGDSNDSNVIHKNALQNDAAAETPSSEPGFGGDLRSAVVGIVKGMVGPAILYLPHGE